MLTISQLRSLTALPHMSDLSLNLLLEFYESTLCGKIFNYELVDDSGNSHSVNLSFYDNNFCHLLGLQHITAKGSKNVKGERGAQDIRNGSVTFDTLKKIHQGQFKAIKHRILYFPFLSQLIEKPSIVQFNNNQIKNCVITCDLMLHDNYESRKVHLGIEKNPDDEYFAKTFIIENKAGTRYIDGQKPLIVQKFEIVTK